MQRCALFRAQPPLCSLRFPCGHVPSTCPPRAVQAQVQQRLCSRPSRQPPPPLPRVAPVAPPRPSPRPAMRQRRPPPAAAAGRPSSSNSSRCWPRTRTRTHIPPVSWIQRTWPPCHGMIAGWLWYRICPRPPSRTRARRVILVSADVRAPAPQTAAPAVMRSRARRARSARWPATTT